PPPGSLHPPPATCLVEDDRSVRCSSLPRGGPARPHPRARQTARVGSCLLYRAWRDRCPTGVAKWDGRTVSSKPRSASSLAAGGRVGECCAESCTAPPPWRQSPHSKTPPLGRQSVGPRQ